MLLVSQYYLPVGTKGLKASSKIYLQGQSVNQKAMFELAVVAGHIDILNEYGLV